jgi:hypothetical protein
VIARTASVLSRLVPSLTLALAWALPTTSCQFVDKLRKEGAGECQVTVTWLAEPAGMSFEPSADKKRVWVRVQDLTGIETRIDGQDLDDAATARILEALAEAGYVHEPDMTLADFRLSAYVMNLERGRNAGSKVDLELTCSVTLAERVPQLVIERTGARKATGSEDDVYRGSSSGRTDVNWFSESTGERESYFLRSYSVATVNALGMGLGTSDEKAYPQMIEKLAASLRKVLPGLS